MRSILKFCLVLLIGSTTVASEPDLLQKDNLVAWCIVPFDAAKRTPEQRAAMLADLGLKRCAYDWRAKHVPEFEREIVAYKKHDIEFFAFWNLHDEAFRLFEKHDLHPQIWYMMPQPDQTLTQSEKIKQTVSRMTSIAERAKQAGCQLGIYNHGGWAGEPQNMVAVCQQLRSDGFSNVGIVYNFHHGHEHIDGWPEFLKLMQPYLLCLNLNGMNDGAQPKILGIGKGQHERTMINTILKSGYEGPIGILDHRNELDARESLQENLRGVQMIRESRNQPSS